MDKWLPLITQALNAEVGRTSLPVSGSKLRSEVGRLASAAKIEFPPPEFPKFSTMVEQYPESMIVLRRHGKDILVVPADRPELLAAEGPRTGAPGNWLRIDVFDAFTKIPSAASGRPIYLPSKDQFTWGGALAEVPEEAIDVPASSLESEIATRQSFVKTVAQDKVPFMSEALASQTPLKDFTQALHKQKLLGDWHKFRLSSLIDQVKSWAAEKGLTWSATWLDTPESKREVLNLMPGAPATASLPKQALAEFVSGLSAEDLKRITIPLDLVLRLLEKR